MNPDAPPPSSSTNLIVKRRRGRQARPCQLSSSVRAAVRRFALAVGMPNVVEPAGFRDFRGWLTGLASEAAIPVWDQLIAVVAQDVGGDAEAVHALKEDLVREIVKCVVVPRPEESAKLVSTNAGRQCSRPRSGSTVMTILELQLARIGDRFPSVNDVGSSSRSTDENNRGASTSASRRRSRHTGVGSHDSLGQASSRSSSRSDGQRLPPVSDIFTDRTPDSSTTLPSFRELEESISKRHGSSSKRRSH